MILELKSIKEAVCMKTEKNLAEDKKVLIKLAESMLPSFITLMIKEGALDVNKLEDKKYLISQLEKNRHLIKNINLQVRTYDDVRLAIESEVKANRKETAILLTATCIEHQLNIFFSNVLSAKNLFYDKQISQILRLTFPNKIDWLFTLICGEVFEENLSVKLRIVNRIRNKIVHYGAISEDLSEDGSGSFNELQREIEKLISSELIVLTVDLEQYLECIFLKTFPEYNQACQICNKAFGITELYHI